MPKEGILNNDDIFFRIMQEVSILQTLHHPNIVALHDFFEEPKSYFIVLEKMTGGELFDRVVAKQFYSEREARDVFKIILNAVDYMHGMNVAHRDIKPENLLLVSRDDDALVKLADFGFATPCDNDANHGMGSLRTQCGTSSYVAPEVLNRQYYGTKSDMWSAGIILYILLGGYPPFIEETDRELYQKIRCGDFEFHQAFWGDISEEAKSLISSLLEVDPKKRLSAKEALNNMWIQCDDRLLEEKDLTTSNFCNLKRFNAIRKVKAAVHSLIAMNRLQFLNSSGIVLK